MMLRVWDQVITLTGLKLATKHGRRFEIVSVSPDHNAITIQVESSRTTYAIHRQYFDQAESSGLTSRTLSPQQLLDAGIDGGRTSYVSAIIRYLANRPITSIRL